MSPNKTIDRHFRPAVCTVLNLVLDKEYVDDILREVAISGVAVNGSTALELQQTIGVLHAYIRTNDATYSIETEDGIQHFVSPPMAIAIFEWASVSFTQLADVLFARGDLTENEIYALEGANEKRQQKHTRQLAKRPPMNATGRRRLDRFLRRVESAVNVEFPSIRTRKSSRYDK